MSAKKIHLLTRRGEESCGGLIASVGAPCTTAMTLMATTNKVDAHREFMAETKGQIRNHSFL